ncbi:MAG: hypothetical protein IH845_00725 [Nanoarchaeota archaeon]|nr:hypothetical protein [Nanoarchaeota archaeon]
MNEEHYFPTKVGTHTFFLSENWRKDPYKKSPIPRNRVKNFKIRVRKSSIHNMIKDDGAFIVFNNGHQLLFICSHQSIRKITNKRKVIWKNPNKKI